MADCNPSKERHNEPRKRVYYADNLRSTLTALVVLHHAAMNYGGVGLAAYYRQKPMSSPPLVGFNVLNQTFFMGSFMFLGGHFSKRTLEKKPAVQVVKDRIYRLGLPAIAYTLFGAPLTMAIHRAWTGKDVGKDFWLQYWKGLRGLTGPVWFIGLLLCFDLLYVALKKAKAAAGNRDDESSKKNSKNIQAAGLAAGLAATSACDFLVRNVYPVGAHLNPLGVQPAYLPHYIASYLFGAYVDDFEDAIPSTAASLGLGLGSVISAYVFAKTLIANKSVQPMLGGLNKSAATYAATNNLVGFLIGTLLLRAFKKYGNQPWGRISEGAYPAFLLHMPILTAITVAAEPWQGGPLVKTATVGSATIVASWLAGYGAKRMLAEAEKRLEATTKTKH